MFVPRKSNDRGHVTNSWLDSYHTFSFGRYYDPEFMGFRALRVINEDFISEGKGFGKHPHDNMEILTYVLDGQLEHKDSMGNGSIINAGDAQLMSAGTGVIHSEFNHSKDSKVHLYQIWILPEHQEIKPSYQQKNFQNLLKENELTLIASPNGENGSLKINQQASVFVGKLRKDGKIEYAIPEGRHLWIQTLKGEVSINKEKFQAGDGLAVSNEKHVTLEGTEESEVMIFDLN
jgi:quercetin 2,3-dioxygenase